MKSLPLELRYIVIMYCQQHAATSIVSLNPIVGKITPLQVEWSQIGVVTLPGICNQISIKWQFTHDSIEVHTTLETPVRTRTYKV